MFSFKITDDDIQREVVRSVIYQRGFMYYLRGYVNSFDFDEEDLQIRAVVLGSGEYFINIYFKQNGAIGAYDCSCPAFRQYPGACKHIVAVLKKAQEEYKKLIDSRLQKDKIKNYIFQYFEQTPDIQTKEMLQMEVQYELENDYGKRLLSVELRVGKERLYIVRNIKQFLERMETLEPLEFGKHFTYDPLTCYFSEEDQRVISLLQEIYEYDKMFEDEYGSSRYSLTTFKGKKVYLTSQTTKRLFNILKNRSFNAKILGSAFSNVSILEEDLPIQFQVKQVEQDLLVDVDYKGKFVPITEDGEYFFYEGNIYHISEKQRIYFAPFYSAFIHNEEGIIFHEREKDRFVSEILPLIKKVAKVDVAKEVQDNLYQKELEVKVYFDKTEKGITAKVEFYYGNIVLNPFKGQEIPLDNKILVRDVEKEREILKVFELSEFKVSQGEVYLEDEDQIFQFIYDELPILQEKASIYYSEDFKNVKIKDTKNFTVGIRLNEETDMLDFSFDYEDLNPEELKNIFESIRKKKKYYRLQDGSFIPLESSSLEYISELVDNLNISTKDLKEKNIQIPKYRAMYIDNYLSETNIASVNRNLNFKRLVKNVREPGRMEFDIPLELQSILRDYQKVGFKWLKTLAYYGFGGILADDMGLGKTLQVIAFILSEKEKNPKPSLVIAPTSLVYNWQDEVEKFAPNMKVVVVSGMKKEREEQLQQIKNVDLVVTSYPLIRRDIDLYKELSFSYCFLDEAQHIKNPNTINARTVKQINAKGYFALTGTPIENSLTELWSIFDFIMPGYLLSHNKFMKKYERPIVKNHDKETLKELRRQISPFILRRMKKDVLKELPEKIESRMTAELTKEQKKIYLAYLQHAKTEMAKEIAAKGFEKSQIKILALLTRLRQICCHPSVFMENYTGGSGKIELLGEILEDGFASGHRVLLFSQFTTMLHLIKQLLDDKGIEYFYLDGSTKAEERGKMVRDFNNGKGNIFLISLKAGGTGLNLTGADMVVHFDPWWNPAVEDQATDRAYRIGQDKVVHVIKLITKGTIEEKIYELQLKKKKMIESVIRPGETLLSKMTREEIEQLFA